MNSPGPDPGLFTASPPYTQPVTDEPRSTKADEIALELEEQILLGEIAPGSVLRQEQLSERFKTSRTPVREALRQLAALDLVSMEAHRGVRVREVARDELRMIFLVRSSLEALAIELAVLLLDDAEIDRIAAAGARFAHLTHAFGDASMTDAEVRSHTAEWIAANDEFHDRIIDAAGSPFLSKTATSVRRIFHVQIIGTRMGGISELYDENLRQHEALIGALRARSPGGARELMREHVIGSGRLLEATLDRIEERARGRDGRPK